MAVVVKKTKGNRYKMHRILMPDGSAFELADTKSESRTYHGEGSDLKGSLAKPIGSAFDDRIAQEYVKNQEGKYSRMTGNQQTAEQALASSDRATAELYGRTINLQLANKKGTWGAD